MSPRGPDAALQNAHGAALDALADFPRLLLAVSGGPDSVALMLLAARWRRRADHDIAVATVDHGLRAGSRAEAEQVGAWARALGFVHHLLTWSGAKPATRVQERARAARYDLLADCAQRTGADAIVTAHHADDQAETILFRLTRGSGVAGLAGMAALTPCGGVVLARPLLALGKARLVAICEDAGHRFFSDPSNADESFARARLRALAPLLAAQGLDRDALLRLGERAARAEAALAHCAAQAADSAIVAADARSATFSAAALRSLPQETLQRLLAAQIAQLAPDRPLRLERLERAAARLAEALAAQAALRLTLADVLIESEVSVVRLRPAPPRRIC